MVCRLKGWGWGWGLSGRGVGKGLVCISCALINLCLTSSDSTLQWGCSRTDAA